MSWKTLIEMLKSRQYSALKERLIGMPAADIAEYIEALDEERLVIIVFRLLPKETAAEAFALLESDTQETICSLVNDRELADIVGELGFDDRIDLLEEMPAYIVKRIMTQQGEHERALINQFLNYHEDSAGSLMTIEFVDLHKGMNAQEAIERIRRDAQDKETVYSCYVIDEERHLEGIVSLKDIIVAPQDALIVDIMEGKPVSVKTDADQEMIVDIFQKYDLLALPVTDAENRLVGIITVDDVLDVAEEEATEDILMMSAVTPTHRPYLETSVLQLAKNRIPWLLLLMISATVTAVIIGRFEDALSAVIVLSASIPMLMDTGGNAGSQVSNTIIRAITLGEVQFRDIFRVVFKEFRVSLICGVVLALVNFGRLVLLTRYEVPVAFVVCITLMFTIIFAKLVGGVLPLLAHKIGLDPALMASPLITTIVDAASLFIYFTTATAVLGV